MARCRRRFDEGKIGDQRAHLRLVFDAAHQVHVAGMLQVHHGRTARLAVFDDQVGAVSVRQAAALDGQTQRSRCLFVLRAKLVGPLDDAGFQGVEELEHLRQIRVPLAGLGQRLADDQPRGLLVQLLGLAADFVAPLRDLLHQGPQFGLQFFYRRLDRFALRVGQFLVLFRAQHFAVARRSQGEPGGRADQLDAPLGRLLRQALKRLRLPLLDFRLDLLQPIAVLLHLQGGRNRGVQVLEQNPQILNQLGAAPGGQPQSARLVGIVEIVDVAPVVRRRLVRRLLLQKTLHDRPLAHPGRSQHVQVIAFAADRDAKANRIQGAGLPHELTEIFQLLRRLEIEAAGIASPTQRGGRQGMDLAHGALSQLEAAGRLPSCSPFPGNLASRRVCPKSLEKPLRRFPLRFSVATMLRRLLG